MDHRELNRIKFRCDDELSENLKENPSDYSGSAEKIKVDRNGRMIVCDPTWLDRVSSLAMLLDDETARNRLNILSSKTQRAYGGDHTISHSVTTATSVLSLLLGIPLKAMISPPDFFAIQELGELVAIADLKRKEEADSRRRGNVTFIEAV